MTATLDPAAADEVYAVHLEPHPRPTVGRVGRAALDLWCACFGGLLDLSRDADVVVRRRWDGGEELRLHVGSAQDAGPVLDQLADDLAASSPEDFRAAWAMDAVPETS